MFGSDLVQLIDTRKSEVEREREETRRLNIARHKVTFSEYFTLDKLVEEFARFEECTFGLDRSKAGSDDDCDLAFKEWFSENFEQDLFRFEMIGHPKTYVFRVMRKD